IIVEELDDKLAVEEEEEEEEAVDIPADKIPEGDDEKSGEEEKEKEEEPMVITQVDSTNKDKELDERLLGNPVRRRAPLGSFSELLAFDNEIQANICE
ncbi:hypothetical protein J6590_081363, partial [Homalodisca vitripennis]